MASLAVDAVPAQEVSNPTQQSDAKLPIRSWRKKFRKMRIVFDRAMEESNTLFRIESKAMAIAKRLKEQNDQLLELLLDINDETHMPSHLRYDLRPSSPSSSAVPSLIPDNGSVSLDKLERTLPHTRVSPRALDLHDELTVDSPLGYFDVEHEEDYLDPLDSMLETRAGYLSDDTTGRPLRPFSDYYRVSERDVALKNPQSVTNWLRRNQPEVFLQDKYEERAGAKASGKASGEGGGGAARGGKRASMASVQTPVATAPAMKMDIDAADDDVSFLEPQPFGSSGRGKKSKDDEPYRPKGGSSRPTKRKRENSEGGKSGKKKSRTSAVSAMDGPPP